MTKRSAEAATDLSFSDTVEHSQFTDENYNAGISDDGQGLLKKPRAFMATLACDICRSRKTRCNEDRPKCGYCKAMNLECTYQSPRPTKKDQSMTVAINAIRRLETKIEDLTSIITASHPHLASSVPSQAILDHLSPGSVVSNPNQGPLSSYSTQHTPRQDSTSTREIIPSEQTAETPSKSPYLVLESGGRVLLSFSQHGVALWPAVKQLLSPSFTRARDTLPLDYVVEFETQRPPLPMTTGYAFGHSSASWLIELPLSVIKGLAEAYFALLNRAMPVLDKFHFLSTTLGVALENEFDYDIETCLVLNVLALGCLAVKAHEEGNFPLPSRHPTNSTGFVRPDWYDLTADDPPGLRFFNEARQRIGFLMCQNDIQAGQFYMLSTLYHAQIVRPIDSWTTVNRAALCCTSLLKRDDSIDFDAWEGDMFCRLFWNALMYESIITQELNLPLSGLQDYEADMPIPKFTPCPRPKTSISGLLIDDDDSFFNFHFLAQAAHRILLSRVKRHMYVFTDKELSLSGPLTDELLHQIEQWKSNLPPSLQFSWNESVERETTPAHVVASAMLRSRYLVAKFHIGRPFIYKALHSKEKMGNGEYTRIAESLKDGLFWPTTMGLPTQMKSALPLKFGWCCQCFGQILLFNVVARSADPKLRATLPAAYPEWVQTMIELIESCAKYSPAIAQDAEILRLLEWP